MLSKLSVQDFLTQTSSNAPVPGGGSVSALAAALGAGLAEMVAGLTIGRKAYINVEDEMKAMAAKASELKEKLTADIDNDSNAYAQVMAAFRLPKETEEEKENRIRSIQDAMKQAALVPLGVAKNAFKVMELTELAVKSGNKNAVTDGVVGAMMARTAAFGALYNVKINLASIKDESFVKDIGGQVKALEAQVAAKEQEILSSSI